MSTDQTNDVVLFVTFQQLDQRGTGESGELARFQHIPPRRAIKRGYRLATAAKKQGRLNRHTSKAVPVWIGPACIVEEIKARLAADVYLEVFLHADPFMVHDAAGETPNQVRRCRRFITSTLDADDDRTGLEHAIKRACEIAEHAANAAAQSVSEEAGEQIGLESRACGILHDLFVKNGCAPSKATIAQLAGCSRQHLYTLPHFMSAFSQIKNPGRHRKPDRRRGRSGRAVSRRNVEDDT